MRCRNTTRCVRCGSAQHYCSSLKGRCHAGPALRLMRYNNRSMDQHHRQHSSSLDRQKVLRIEPCRCMRTVAPTCNSEALIIGDKAVSRARLSRAAKPG